ncbi:DUF1883 domain-containing protein [Burkholderia sp. WAC0059]|uniref:DUF1883 domain-containing protein n=1 Tax=Burkholderia sp. WAC0059 TaxID=2066022 RepID=UPI000C7F7141|nr:DUF1883 domain-containing protein [Burkholderia sp. WAC0059]PLZ01888.1 DUF1883 domain-containing protein [Burkholderia sp. WAC0059]
MSEKFSYYDLGHLQSGQIVEVTLSGNAANVRLMDSSNFSSYKRGGQHRYYGGLAKQSPVRLQVPSSGRWYVTIDMQGLRGSVRHSMKVLPSPLPAIREAPLSSIPSLVRPESPPTYERSSEQFDVFISHASEDKDEVARPMAEALQSHGLKVWYDEFTLRIGDSLRRKIDEGLTNSRVGLVVLSPAFLNKGWTNHELDGIVTRSVTGEQVLLPIWHKLSKQEVISYSPSLADKLARNTATHTIEEIAAEIAELIRAS